MKSCESDDYFPDNRLYHFKVYLKLPFYLDGLWKVALVQFQATEKSKWKASAELYIYSDLCGESIVKGQERPLLRRLEKNKKSEWDYNIDNPFSVPVRKKEQRDFEIYIKQVDDADASDLSQPVHITLHLKRYLFY